MPMNLKLSDRAKVRSSTTGLTLGLYIDDELHRPLNTLEEHMAKRIQKLEEAEAKRDALAAHVSILESIINGSNLTDRTEVMSALNSAPEASLARLKAQWQAEVLDELMPAICDVADRAEVRSLRDELRRQAEGENHE